jgi:hypothetical protein
LVLLIVILKMPPNRRQQDRKSSLGLGGTYCPPVGGLLAVFGRTRVIIS